MAIYFISEQYLKANTAISALVDPADIAPQIPAAQDMWTQDILGSNFYNYLWNAYSAQTLTTNEITLVEKIKPALAWRCAEMTVPFLNYKISNKGMQTQNGDFSNSVTLEELRYLRHELKNNAEFYEERLIKYLCDNGNLYPQYSTNNSTDLSPNNQTTYDCDLAFPSTRCGIHCTSCNNYYYGTSCGCH